GVANVAEETVKPQKTILKGFGSAIVTLVLLCVLTFMGAVGVAGWQKVVYTANGTVSDSPLPLAMGQVVGAGNLLYHLLITVGLFGLVASFHGIILAAGRATFQFGRVGFAPSFTGKVHSRFHTPSNALLVNMIIGVIALLTGRTAEIITISVFGALTLYALSMIALIKLRRAEPDLHRPFKVPFYPVFPVVALVISFLSFIALAVLNQSLAAIYFLILAITFGLYKIFYKDPNLNNP
ncbi:MAG TPA: ethanolamine permease, partial [Flavisolibacter sp.]|nr:ethanolamine permease [Flavisolibacter sp.]